jgi:hypothetical protein
VEKGGQGWEVGSEAKYKSVELSDRFFFPYETLFYLTFAIEKLGNHNKVTKEEHHQ